MFIILAVLCFISAVISCVSFFKQGGTANFFAMLSSLISAIAFIKIASMQNKIEENEKHINDLEKGISHNRHLIEELHTGMSNNYASIQELSKTISTNYHSIKKLENQISDLQSNSDEDKNS